MSGVTCFYGIKAINGRIRIRVFKVRIRIGEKNRIHPDKDPKHCYIIPWAEKRGPLKKLLGAKKYLKIDHLPGCWPGVRRAASPPAGQPSGTWTSPTSSSNSGSGYLAFFISGSLISGYYTGRISGQLKGNGFFKLRSETFNCLKTYSCSMFIMKNKTCWWRESRCNNSFSRWIKYPDIRKYL